MLSNPSTDTKSRSGKTAMLSGNVGTAAMATMPLTTAILTMPTTRPLASRRRAVDGLILRVPVI